jgi:signal transduction histidine kinase/DNA-binding NarL/FixJ family response regulator
MKTSGKRSGKKRALHNAPLSVQLSLVSLLANALSLTAAALLIIAVEFAFSWFDNVRHMSVTAKIIGDNARSALVFDDRTFAAKALQACSAHTNIRQAVLYRPDRSVLAAYHRDPANPEQLPPHFLKAGHEYRDGQLLLTQTISYEDGEAGTLAIRADLHELFAKIGWFSLSAMLAMLISILLVTPLRRHMQTTITRPLFTLVEAINNVRAKGDYGVRVETERQDELGQLINGFNEMLKGIKERDQKLEQHSQELEGQVQQRTWKLTETNQELQREIQERRTVQRELARFKTTLDETSDGVIMFHPETLTIFYANRGAEEMAAISSGTLTHSCFSDLLPGLDNSKLNTTLKGLRNPQTAFNTIESDLHPLDAPPIPVQIFLQYIEPNSGDGRYLAIIHNITEQKELERSLREARDAAEAASRAKGLFLANMSHEIRTPMNAVLGMTQLALNTELNQQQRNYLEKIDGSAGALLNILNDILDLSRIEADKLVVEQQEFDLQQLLEETTQLMAVSCHGKDLELLLDIPSATPQRINSDPQRLRQVLTNLLGNAIKFTERGHVMLSVEPLSVERDGASSLRFAVEDTGLGVTRKQVENLFEPFSQLDPSHSRKYGGSGLGLALSKRLVELMGGEIGGKPLIGGGSCFYFTLPYNHKRPPAPALDPALKGYRVLIIDGYPASRQILTKSLRRAGATTSSSNGDALPATARFDLALYNHHPSVGDQLPALNQLAELDIPLLVMEYNGLAEGSLQWQAAGTIPKPQHPQRLAKILANFIEGKPLVEPGSHKNLGELFKQERGMTSCRVLLAEDLAINQEIAREFLEGAGHEVVIAENGEQVIKRVESQTVDLILMDVQMPVMDGLEATRRLRADPRFRELPIIAMTAHAMRGDRDLCLAAGMNDYLTKPLIPEVLLTSIRKWSGAADSAQESHTKKPDRPPPTIRDIHSLPGVNAAIGLQRMMNKEDLFQRMLLRFNDYYANAGETIRAMIDECDYDQAHTTVHGIKGIAANLSMEALRASCIALEEALKGNHGEIGQCLDDFLDNLEQINQGLASWRRTLDEE